MTSYTISTDALTTTIEAASRDEAARKFAAGESTYRGCETAADVSARAEELGGWAKIEEAA